MEKKDYWLTGLLIGMGMFLMGGEIRQGIRSFKAMDRIVTVKGLAEREVDADKVIWPLMFKEIGNDPAVMYNSIEQKNKAVIAFLKGAGVKDEEISVAAPTITDRQADYYGNEIMSYRYKATSVITVTSSNVKNVRALMRRQAELMKLGIAIVSEEYGMNQVRYEFTSLNDIKPEMIQEATKNARVAAEQFAKDADNDLGDIRTATQGQFSIEDRDANTPYIKKVRVVSTIEYMLD